MYKLYGFKGSGSAAIEMALDAAGAVYTKTDVASWDSSTPVHELSVVNPLLQIPALVLPDKTILTESAAILIYLADAYPSAGIIAQSPMQRAKTIQGLIYLTANCYPAVGIIDFPERWTASKDPAELEHVRNGTRNRLNYLWEVFTDSFTGSPYLSGPQPGVLDFLAVTIGRMFKVKDYLAESRPAFYALLSKLESHPRLAGVVARHWG